mgnify:CR=1 FL=1|tara:strand:- start:224 stop:823 length:600 start_codon:yes stop_codon:yes gene_type:complete
MIVIGWDIGIKNLAYCVVEIKNEKFKILDWNIIDLRSENQIEGKKKCAKISLKDLSRSLYENLESNKIFKKFDYIIIENQPVLKNPTMKSIQMILYSYFAFKSLKLKDFKDLILMNASNKMKVYTKPIDKTLTERIDKLKSKYSRNKKLSILHSELILEEHSTNDWLDFFKSNKKKDDLADAFLMCMYFGIKNKYINNF